MPPLAQPAVAPTGLRRWTPTFSMMLVSMISYVDRQTLALLSPTILRETHLTGEQYGFSIFGFSIAYMFSNPVWGRILDRIGLRVGMTASVSFWTLASAAHAFASGFWSFAAARTALGFGEGATFPGGFRTVTQTLSVAERGRGTAIAYSGGSLGAILTPIIVTPIALQWGWRAAFLFTGFIGLAWLALWKRISRRPDVNQITHSAATARAPRWSDPRLWSFICTYALGALPMGFVLYQMANYLAQARGESQGFIGAVLWIPPVGWEAGYFFWGWVLDGRVRAGVAPVLAIRKLMLLTMVFGVLIAVVPYLPAMWAVMGELALAMFVSAGFVILSVAYATHVFSPDHSGYIAGIGAGSWSAVVGLTAPLFGRLFDQHRYDAAFAVAALFPILGYCCWLWLDRWRAPQQQQG
jgi:ACS family hexuronate transporter-like MFS transporter